MSIQNALTIDVEDYYQVTNFERHISRKDWPSYPSRVVESTRRILRLLERHNTSATFFILGYVAEKHPDLVKEISAAGHEVGSHSYWHRLVYQMNPDDFRQDLCRSRDVLQDLTGKPVTSYRSPSFSITKKSLWALEILAEEGFANDSSVFPVHRHRYGIPDAHREPYAHELQSGNLREFPISVCRLGNRFNVPMSGGGYFRLFPYQLTRRLLNQFNRESDRPFVFYIHPWEFDPCQPRLKAGTRAERFRHYVNLAKTEAKFERLLQSFAFCRLDTVLDHFFSANTHQTISHAALAS